MAGFDVNMLLQAQPVVAPDPVAQYGKALTLADLARRNRMGALEEEETGRRLETSRAYENALPGLVESNWSAEAIANTVRANPRAAPLVLKEADARQKAALDRDKTTADIDKTRSETSKASLAIVGGLAQTIIDKGDAATPRDLQALAGWMQKLGVDAMGYGDPRQDPRAWLQNVVGSSIDAAKQMELAGQREQRQETRRHNTTTEGISRDTLDETRRYHTGTLGIQGATLAETKRNHDLVNARTVESNQVARDSVTDNRTNAEVQALAKFIDSNGLPNLLTSANALDKEIQKYTKTDPATGKTSGDIPGTGRIVGMLPAQLLTTEGKAVRSKVQAMANDLLKLYSGGAVTLNEFERRQVEMMATGSFTADDLREAWPVVTGRINAAAQNVRAGFSPKAVSTYEGRGGLKLEPVGSDRQEALPAGAKQVNKLPSPSSLANGTRVRDDETGEILVVRNGKYAKE